MEDNTFTNFPDSETEVLQPEIPVETPEIPVQTPETPVEAPETSTGFPPQFGQDGGSLMDKIKAVPQKLWIAAGAALVALIAVIVLLNALGNTYKTPIKTAEELLNTKSLTKIIDKVPSMLNGFGESEAKQILKTIKKSDEYKDMIEDAEDAFDEMLETVKDECGKNYKISIKVEDKDKLENADLRAFRDELRDIGDLAKEIDDLDSDDYEDMADEIGLSKKQVKDMVKAAESFCKDCKSAKVSKGYELDLIVTVTGRELDEPEEMDLSIRVFKVDGRWVPDVFSLLDMVDIGDLMSLI